MHVIYLELIFTFFSMTGLNDYVDDGNVLYNVSVGLTVGKRVRVFSFTGFHCTRRCHCMLIYGTWMMTQLEYGCQTLLATPQNWGILIINHILISQIHLVS